MRQSFSVGNHIKSLVFYVLALHGSVTGQTIPSKCLLVDPVGIVLVNDKHPANFNPPPPPFGALFCVQDEIAEVELCLPIGVVAGDISLSRSNSSGIMSEQVLPGRSGPHCKVVKSFVRPDHAGTAPNYQCLTRAVSIVDITLSPLRRVAVCS